MDTLIIRKAMFRPEDATEPAYEVTMPDGRHTNILHSKLVEALLTMDSSKCQLDASLAIRENFHNDLIWSLSQAPVFVDWSGSQFNKTQTEA